MFGAPTSGFVKLELPGFSGLASFAMNDVVGYTLLTLRVALANRLPLCLSYDAEGEEHIIVVTCDSGFAITEYFSCECPTEIVSIPCGIHGLAKEILDDFDSRFEEWLLRAPRDWNRERFRQEVDEVRALMHPAT